MCYFLIQFQSLICFKKNKNKMMSKTQYTDVYDKRNQAFSSGFNFNETTFPEDIEFFPQYALAKSNYLLPYFNNGNSCFAQKEITFSYDFTIPANSSYGLYFNPNEVQSNLFLINMVNYTIVATINPYDGQLDSYMSYKHVISINSLRQEGIIAPNDALGTLLDGAVVGSGFSWKASGNSLLSMQMPGYFKEGNVDGTVGLTLVTLGAVHTPYKPTQGWQLRIGQMYAYSATTLSRDVFIPAVSRILVINNGAVVSTVTLSYYPPGSTTPIVLGTAALGISVSDIFYFTLPVNGITFSALGPQVFWDAREEEVEACFFKISQAAGDRSFRFQTKAAIMCIPSDDKQNDIRMFSPTSLTDYDVLWNSRVFAGMGAIRSDKLEGSATLWWDAIKYLYEYGKPLLSKGLRFLADKIHKNEDESKDKGKAMRIYTKQPESWNLPPKNIGRAMLKEVEKNDKVYTGRVIKQKTYVYSKNGKPVDKYGVPIVHNVSIGQGYSMLKKDIEKKEDDCFSELNKEVPYEPTEWKNLFKLDNIMDEEKAASSGYCVLPNFRDEGVAMSRTFLTHCPFTGKKLRKYKTDNSYLKDLAKLNGFKYCWKQIDEDNLDDTLVEKEYKPVGKAMLRERSPSSNRVVRNQFSKKESNKQEKIEIEQDKEIILSPVEKVFSTFGRAWEINKMVKTLPVRNKDRNLILGSDSFCFFPILFFSKTENKNPSAHTGVTFVTSYDKFKNYNIDYSQKIDLEIGDKIKFKVWLYTDKVTELEKVEIKLKNMIEFAVAALGFSSYSEDYQDIIVGVVGDIEFNGDSWVASMWSCLLSGISGLMVTGAIQPEPMLELLEKDEPFKDVAELIGVETIKHKLKNEIAPVLIVLTSDSIDDYYKELGNQVMSASLAITCGTIYSDSKVIVCGNFGELSTVIRNVAQNGALPAVKYLENVVNKVKTKNKKTVERKPFSVFEALSGDMNSSVLGFMNKLSDNIVVNSALNDNVNSTVNKLLKIGSVVMLSKGKIFDLNRYLGCFNGVQKDGKILYRGSTNGMLKPTELNKLVLIGYNFFANEGVLKGIAGKSISKATDNGINPKLFIFDGGQDFVDEINKKRLKDAYDKIRIFIRKTEGGEQAVMKTIFNLLLKNTHLSLLGDKGLHKTDEIILSLGSPSHNTNVAKQLRYVGNDNGGYDNIGEWNNDEFILTGVSRNKKNPGKRNEDDTSKMIPIGEQGEEDMSKVIGENEDDESYAEEEIGDVDDYDKEEVVEKMKEKNVDKLRNILGKKS